MRIDRSQALDGGLFRGLSLTHAAMLSLRPRTGLCDGSDAGHGPSINRHTHEHISIR